MRSLFLILFVSILAQTVSYAQEETVNSDTTIVETDTTTTTNNIQIIDTPLDTLTVETIEHSPGLASLYSAVLPGLGQAYNRSYWKIPLVYTALFTFAYLTVDANDKYQFVRRNLIAATDNDPETINYTGRSVENLTSNRDALRRSRDFNMILFFIIYLLNVADAHIDAHLVEFQANPDINAFVDPKMIGIQNGATGLGLSFTMKF